MHAYMRKRRKTEAKEKAEELESTRLRVATDNLAVLAQVSVSGGRCDPNPLVSNPCAAWGRCHTGAG